VDVSSIHRRDETLLEPISKMSRLQILEIKEDRKKSEDEPGLPARAFIPLGSLAQLRLLKIGTSFFPNYMNEQTENEGEERSIWDDPIDSSRNDRFVAADAFKMFSGLTLLTHLSLRARVFRNCHCLLEDISTCCPQLSSIEFVGKLDLWCFIYPSGVKFSNIRQMVIGDVLPGISTLQAARLIDDFAPQLRMLSFIGERGRSKEMYTAWVGFRKTQGFFRDKRRLRVGELVLRKIRSFPAGQGAIEVVTVRQCQRNPVTGFHKAVYT